MKEVVAATFFVRTVGEDLRKKKGMKGGRRKGIKEEGKKEVGKEGGKFEEAEGAKVAGQGVVKEKGEDEKRAEEAFELARSDEGERKEAKMGLPGFEEDLDAPAQAIEVGRARGGQEGGIGVGEEDGPGEKGVVFLGMVDAAVAVGASLAAAGVGDLLRERKSQKA